jgi:alkanesulfonate monooxygenase SsuD/methylene tetrahydromethanopterin reductase-like flavin-dependent oxidoreductase (luciferase family)
MRLGLFSTIQSRPGEEAEAVRRYLRHIERAEAGGFDSAWLAERHFTGYGAIGNPLVFAGAVAARTTRIRIGFAALILALHNPYQLAEELAMRDVLAGGRLLVGVGSGRAGVEASALGLEFEEPRALLDESLALLPRVWAGEPFEHAGPHFPGRFPGAGLRPRPHPPLLRAIVHDDSVIAAGECPHADAAGPLPAGDVAPQRRSLPAHVGRGRCERGRGDALLQRSGALRHVVIAPSEAEAHAVAREAMAGDIDRANEVNEPHELDEFLERACVYGTASTVAERLLEVDALGIGTAIGWIDFGGIAPDRADATLEALIAEVLPAVAEPAPA